MQGIVVQCHRLAQFSSQSMSSQIAYFALASTHIEKIWVLTNRNKFTKPYLSTQQAHNVKTTSNQRWVNVKTLNQGWIDVVSMRVPAETRCSGTQHPTQCWDNVVCTSMQRHDIVSTLIRRCINAMCPQGSHWTQSSSQGQQPTSSKLWCVRALMREYHLFGFTITKKMIIFHICTPKHRLWVLIRTASARRF